MADPNDLVIENQLGMVLDEEGAVTLIDAPSLDSSIILTDVPTTEGLQVSHLILPNDVTVAGFEEVGEEVEMGHSWDSLTSSSGALEDQDSTIEGATNPDVFLAFVEDSLCPMTLLASLPGNESGGEVIVQRMYEIKDDLMFSQGVSKEEEYFSEEVSSDKPKLASHQIVKLFIKDDKKANIKEESSEEPSLPKEEKVFHEDEFLLDIKVKDDSEIELEKREDPVVKKEKKEHMYHCTDCNLNFSSNKAFKNHMEAHLIRLQNSCALCDKEFQSKSSLQEHIKDHFAKSSAVTCEICKKEFVSKTVLKRHKKQIHSSNGQLINSLKCEICGSVFSSKFSLKSHAATHSTRKPFACKECGATFTQNGSLQVHLRRHRGEKPFKCDICGNNFTRAHSLKVHMKTHTGEKPYPCEYCGACFVTSSHLTVHRRTHTGERPYCCNECGATFITTSHLNVHRRLHNNHSLSTLSHKVLNCTLCGDTFDDPGKLRHHRRTEHKDSLQKSSGSTSKCKVCSKKFSSQSQFLNHMNNGCS